MTAASKAPVDNFRIEFSQLQHTGVVCSIITCQNFLVDAYGLV